MGEFDDFKDQSKARRQFNRARTPQVLKDHGVQYISKNDGAHLIVEHNGYIVDLWPGPGRWTIRATGKSGRGVFRLLERLGVDSKAYLVMKDDEPVGVVLRDRSAAEALGDKVIELEILR